MDYPYHSKAIHNFKSFEDIQSDILYVVQKMQLVKNGKLMIYLTAYSVPKNQYI